MIENKNKDPMDQKIREYFYELYRDSERGIPEEEIPDIPMASWEEIERMADEMMASRATNEPERAVKDAHGKTYPSRKKVAARVFLAATIGTLLLAGVANGSRLYQYMVEQQWKGGQNVLSLDSNKVVSDSESPYEEAVAEILEKTGVQSVQPMDHSWILSSYEIEGQHSYLEFEKDGDIIHVKQRIYSGEDISLGQSDDKEYCGEESNDLIPEIKCAIYSESILGGETSYSTTFVYGESIYVVRSKCGEKKFVDFIKSIYIKNRN